MGENNKLLFKSLFAFKRVHLEATFEFQVNSTDYNQKPKAV